MVRRTAALAASALALGVSGARAAEPLVSELPDVVAGTPAITLDFNIPGQTVTTEANPDAEGIAKLFAKVDSPDNIMTLTWGSSYDATDFDTIDVRGCFTTVSAAGRKWRKPKDKIKFHLKNHCPVKIYNGAWDTNTATWTPNEATPGAAYQLEAFAKNAAGDYVAYSGNAADPPTKSFKVVPVDAVTGSLRAAAAICSCVGPIIIIAYFIYDNAGKQD